MAVHWGAFQAALTGPTRKYPSQKFLSFAAAAQRYFDFTRHDQLIHRDIAKFMNDLTENLRLERRRVPNRILYEADRLECLFFLRTSRATNLPVYSPGIDTCFC